MVELCCSPNVKSYGILLEHLCKSKNIVEPCNLVFDTVKKELKPDVCTNERFIRCLSEVGEKENMGGLIPPEKNLMISKLL